MAMFIDTKTRRIVFAAALMMILGLMPLGGQALTFENVTFSDSIQAGTTTLYLHGTALLRYLKLIRAYVAALYLPEKIDPDSALSDVPKRLELYYMVSIKGPDFGKGAEPVLQRNQTPDEMTRLRSRIDRINALYRDVKPGDRYSLTYLPGEGTELSLNGTPLAVIEGADFAAAYFGIWLGGESIDGSLKRDLLKGR